MRKTLDTSLELAFISNDQECKTFFDSLDASDWRVVKNHLSHYPCKIQRIIIIRLYRKQPAPL